MRNTLRVLSLALVCGAAAWGQSGFKGEFLNEVNALEKKFVSLAKAMPAEKYGWRPADGVRSVSEVFVHVAGANAMIPRAIGVQPPANALPRDAEKTIKDKEKVVAALEQSFAHLRTINDKVADGDLDKPVKLFGREVSTRAAMMVVATHMHEHLGQSIAYARMNGVTPPWSQGRE